MITLPTNLALHDWADQVVTDLRPAGFIDRLQGGDWQSWGVQFASLPLVRGLPPDPYGFTVWQEWAERLCGCVN